MSKVFAVLGVMVFLGPAVHAQDAPVFPADLCASSPALSESEQNALWERLPEFKGAPARRVTAEAGLALLERAVAEGRSSLALFTEDAVRQDCVFVIPAAALQTLEAAYELFLLAPFSGTDTEGKPFRMTAILFGRGRLVHFYERAGIRFKHPHFDDTFSYEQVIREATPAPGVLTIKGVTGPMGLSIAGLKALSADKVEVTAGIFKVTRPLRKIQRITPTARREPPSAARTFAWLSAQ